MVKKGDIVTWAHYFQSPEGLEVERDYEVLGVTDTKRLILNVVGDTRPDLSWEPAMWKLSKNHYIAEFIHGLPTT